jgi:catechol 2,3-dioxygenase-like lactoylglutathione lyase family enzyme
MASTQSTLLFRSAPISVANVERSLAFYEKTLGFRCEYSAGAPLQFAICSRDGLGVMLRLVMLPELIVPNENRVVRGMPSSG